MDTPGGGERHLPDLIRHPFRNHLPQTADVGGDAQEIIPNVLTGGNREQIKGTHDTCGR
ncbi:MAG: hypothetical protein M0Z27_03405 [Thermaerobacter sp.]|nr:hypothetical protein [Thermaerobacter sp.]